MANLTREVQTFLVQQLACFATPSEAAAAVAEEFGVAIDRMQARKYTPDNPELAERWRVLFEATRETFIRETTAIGIAHRAYRLRRLEVYLHAAEQRGNHVQAAQLLRQAAEETGGALTNRRELSGKDGQSLAPSVVLYLPDNGREKT